MKIIVVGGGKVGTALCRSLVAENHDVILIEQDEAVLNQITKRYDIIGIAGNGANFKILEQAGSFAVFLLDRWAWWSQHGLSCSGQTNGR